MRSILCCLAFASLVVAQMPARSIDLGGGCGPSPQLFLAAPPALGVSTSLQLDSSAPFVGGILAASPPTAPTPFPSGCALHLDLGALITLPFVTDAQGDFGLPLTFPQDPNLAGFTLALQAVVATGSGAFFGGSLSNGLRLEVGNPVVFLVAGDRFIDQSLSTVVSAASLLGVDPSVLVNDNNPVTQGNPWLPWSTLGAGTVVTLPTGEVGSEGLAALTGTLPFSLAAFLAGTVPQSQLDPIPGVMPLSNLALADLVGKSCVVLVYDGSLSIGYQPLLGNLQGARNGLFAFTVLGVSSPTLPESQSSNSLFDLTVRIDAPLAINNALPLAVRDLPADSVQFQQVEWQAGVLVVRAVSSSAPIAQLTITIPGFTASTPLTFDPQNGEYVAMIPAPSTVIGLPITVSSSLGGSYNDSIQ